MSIRLRLTLLYTAILAALLTAFGAAIYSSLNFNLNQQINQSITDTATQILNLSGPISIQSGQTAFGIPELDVFQTSNIYSQAWSTDGELKDQSDNLGPLREPLDPEALDSDAQIMRDVVIGSARVRVLTVPIEVNDEIFGHLQVAASLEPLGRAREQMLVIMLVGSGVAVVLSGLTGYWLANRALRPIQSITTTAEQIAKAGDLGQRIAYDGPTDELGRLVKTFNSTLTRLERLFNAQRRLVADVSHELRTPLTSIRGNVDLLRRIGSGDDVSLQAIEDEMQRMTRLVDDLLLLAQADAGRLSLVKYAVQLDTLLLEVYSHAKILVDKEIDISLDVNDSALVFGDSDRLKQLLLNLVSNAIKHTTTGDSIQLGIKQTTATAEESVAAWAEITIADTGTGIPAEDLPYIFNRFYRVDRARSRTGGGTGLGLSIAQWIAEAHEGQLTVTSELGRGTTFRVRLPLLTTDTLPRTEAAPQMTKIPQPTT